MPTFCPDVGNANRDPRAALATVDGPCHFPPLRYRTDNAATIAGLAAVHLAAGRVSGLDLDAVTFSEIACGNREA